MIVEQEEEEKHMEIDTRTCIYTWHCLKIDCTQQDTEYHVVFCSVECQERYTRHRKRAWTDVTADAINETELPLEFDQLWKLHVSLTRQLIMAVVRPGGQDATVHRLREAIIHNNRALGRLFAVTYGGVFGDQVTGLLNEHATLTLRVLEELARAREKPVDRALYLQHNMYYDEWLEQALDLVRFVYERIAPDSNDETGESRLEGQMRAHLLFTLGEMLHEVNGERSQSLALYREDDAEISRMSQSLASYFGLDAAHKQRDSNRAFETMWRAHAHVLCQWLQSAIGSMYDDAETDRVSQVYVVLTENVSEIAMNAFIVKYGAEFSQAFQRLYVLWLQNTGTLIMNIVASAGAKQQLHNNLVYTSWLESMGAVAQLLDVQMTSSIVTEERPGSSSSDVYDYLRVYRELVLRFITGVVSAWQRMTLSPSSLLSHSMRDVSIGITTVATEDTSPDATRVELENQCARLADYLLGFIDQ